MAEWPLLGSYFNGLVTISTLSPESMGPALSVTPTSGTWPTTNLAIYVPFRIGEPLAVTALWAFNGATATANLDLGIYSFDGTKLISTGSTALAGTNTIQVVNVTTTILYPGVFYLAMACNNTTPTNFLCVMTAARGILMGCAQQATAFALPAVATMAQYAQANIPWMGLAAKQTV